MLKDSHLEKLEALVEELIKDVPEENRVREMMFETGLAYTEDPVQRINMVLQALHFEEGVDSNQGKEVLK